MTDAQLDRWDWFEAALLVVGTWTITVLILGARTAILGPTGRSLDTVAMSVGAWRLAFILGATVLASGLAAALLITGRTENSNCPDESGSSQSGADSSTDDLLEARRAEWAETAERLANAEATIYETVLEADGVLPQREIVEQTNLSKATVSRTLDSLEAKSLLERKSRGTGNVVVLR